MLDGILYDDGLIALDDDGITLRRYYFPVATSKRVIYADIRGVERRSMGAWTGKGRLWGTGDFRHWTPLDPRRSHKDTAIVLDLGGFVRPVFSPEDPDRVLNLLGKHVRTTSA